MANKTTILGGIALGSVLLNAFLLGIFVGHCPMRGPQGFGPPPGHFGRHEPFMEMRHAAEKLPAPYRQKVESIIDGKKEQLKKTMAGMGDAFPEIQTALTAPHYDPGKLKEIQDKLENYDKALKTDLTDTMNNIAGALPDKERIEFFKNILPPGPRGPGSKMPMPPPE